ncbi:hypothetical protein [Mesoterricola silvestris]|nr:hypothetical protein [Mesoterricola silvestris]
MALVFASLLACGGKSGGSTAPTLANVGGVYSGKDAGGKLHYAAVKAGDGSFSWLGVDRSLTFGTFNLDGTTLAGLGLQFLARVPIAQDAPMLVQVGGTAGPGQITLRLSYPGNTGTAVTFTKEPDSNGTTQLSDLAATYNASAEEASNGTGATLNIAADGTLSGGDSAVGSLSGTVTQPTAGVNYFTVAFTYTPTNVSDGGPISFNGVAFRLRGARSGLVLAAHSPSSQYSGIFTPVLKD